MCGLMTEAPPRERPVINAWEDYSSPPHRSGYPGMPSHPHNA